MWAFLFIKPKLYIYTKLHIEVPNLCIKVIVPVYLYVYAT